MLNHGFDHIVVPDITVTVHPSCESIFHRFWSFGEDVPLEEIMEGTAGLCNDNGEEKEVPMSEMLETTRENGFWGFSNCPDGQVHIWSAKGMAKRELTILIAHEVGHILETWLRENTVGAEEVLGKAIPEHTHDEIQADNYAIAALLVPELVEGVFKKTGWHDTP